MVSCVGPTMDLMGLVYIHLGTPDISVNLHISSTYDVERIPDYIRIET